MKILRLVIISILLSFWLFSHLNASFWERITSWESATVRYCEDEADCGLDNGISIIKDGITDIEKERGAAEYIQDIVVFLIGFITLVAVIYIIYAGFQILIWNWDEEKLKKSKQTILYVVIWIIVIWLAYTITDFIITFVLNAWTAGPPETVVIP